MPFFTVRDLIRFCEASNRERIDILTQILDLEAIDAWAERTKDLVKDAEVHAAQREELVYEATQHSRQRIKELTEQWETERKAYLDKLEQASCHCVSKSWRSMSVV